MEDWKTEWPVYTLMVTGFVAMGVVVGVMCSLAIESLMPFLLAVSVDVRITVSLGIVSGTVTAVSGCVAFSFIRLSVLRFGRSADVLSAELSNATHSIVVNAKELVTTSTATVEAIREAQSEISAVERLYKTTEELCARLEALSDEELKTIQLRMESRLNQIVTEFDDNYFRLTWNSLPFHQLFGTFSEQEKVMYFDAVTSGNWERLRRRLRSRR